MDVGVESNTKAKENSEKKTASSWLSSQLRNTLMAWRNERKEGFFSQQDWTEQLCFPVQADSIVVIRIETLHQWVWECGIASNGCVDHCRGVCVTGAGQATVSDASHCMRYLARWLDCLTSHTGVRNAYLSAFDSSSRRVASCDNSSPTTRNNTAECVLMICAVVSFMTHCGTCPSRHRRSLAASPQGCKPHPAFFL